MRHSSRSATRPEAVSAADRKVTFAHGAEEEEERQVVYSIDNYRNSLQWVGWATGNYWNSINKGTKLIYAH